MPFLIRKVLISCGSSDVPACGGVVAVALGLGEALADVVRVVLGVGEEEAASEVFGEADGLVVVEADGVELPDDEALTAVDGETDDSGVKEGDVVTEGDGDADFVATGVGEVADLGMAMPLFQISFLPDLTQVNFLPL